VTRPDTARTPHIPIDANPAADHDGGMADDADDADDAGGDEPDLELDPREAARDRRRDREAAAERRALMRPGMGKVFKQILDRRGREADEPPERRDRRRSPRDQGTP
jgi:hypothetical protein